MRLVADSFAWPFRGDWQRHWSIGLLCVLLFPLLFVPLFGYAIEAIRAAELDASQGPPRWRWSRVLLLEGGWTAFAVALSLLPFVVLFNPIVNAQVEAGVGALAAHLVAFFGLAFLWGLVALTVAPYSMGKFALSGSPADLFDVGGALRTVAKNFSGWNLAVAAVVTAWAAGLACAGLLCVGIVPGVFYAILVSAHASASLHRQSSALPAR